MEWTYNKIPNNMEKFIRKSIENNQFELIIDSAIFDLKIIKKTAYLFLDKWYIFLKKDWNNILIQFKLKDEKLNIEDILWDFSNELLNTSLREEITSENQKLREEIISAAINHSLREAMFQDESSSYNQNSSDLSDKNLDEILKEIELELELDKKK